MNKETVQNSRRRSGSEIDTSEILIKKIKTETNSKMTGNIKRGKHNLESSGFLNNLYSKLLFPSHFRSIFDIFVSLDIVVNKLLYRNEDLYFDRICECLKQMNKKFDTEVFGQILTIFPESYSYEFQKSSKIFQNDNLILIPKLDFGKKKIDSSPSPCRVEKGFSLSQLLIRRYSLQDRLLKLVEEKHNDFLINVKKLPKIVTESQMKPVSWHPEFDLEKGVDKIQPTCLDEKKLSTNKSTLIRKSWNSCVTRKSIEEICKKLFNTNPVEKPEKAEQNVEHVEAVKQPQKIIKQFRLSPVLVDVPISVDSNLDKQNEKEKSTIKREFTQKRRLPFHLKTLFELFIGLDKAVRDAYCKKELCYLSKVSPSVSMKKNFTEVHLGKIIRVYPESFLLKWARVTRKSSTRMELLIKPNLRHDGTSSASLSPKMGFINFDFIRLKERRQLFLDKCEEMVISSYSNFLAKKLCSSQDIEKLVKDNYWDRRFNVDLYVKMVDPIDMPPKNPIEIEEEKELVTITQFFQQFQKNKTKKFAKLESKPVIVPPTSTDKLNSVKEEFFTHVNNIRKNWKLIKQYEVENDNSQVSADCEGRTKIMISKLLEIVRIIDIEFQKESYKPLDRTHLKNVICQSLSITENSFDEYLTALMQLFPDWIESLDWARPFLRICNNSKLTTVEVIQKLNTIISAQLENAS